MLVTVSPWRPAPSPIKTSLIGLVYLLCSHFSRIAFRRMLKIGWTKGYCLDPKALRYISGVKIMKDHNHTDVFPDRWSRTSSSPSTLAVRADTAEMGGLGKSKHQGENGQNEATVEFLANEFNAYGKAAAEQIIRRGRTVARAKGTLGYSGFQEFCRLVRLDPKSSTCRKYIRIGAEADWLLPIAAHLPGRLDNDLQRCKAWPDQGRRINRPWHSPSSSDR
jgi:hypothetical protein